MREIIVAVTCDACHQPIKEEDALEVRLNVGTEAYEADLCGECLPNWTQSMRPVKVKPKKTRSAGDFACDDCGNRYTTARGLSRHRNLAHL